MVNILANSGYTAYGVKTFVVDTIEDLKNIQVEDLAAGSTTFIINTSEQYMLNSQKIWIKINEGTGSGGGSIDPTATYIYDGGLLTL